MVWRSWYARLRPWVPCKIRLIHFAFRQNSSLKSSLKKCTKFIFGHCSWWTMKFMEDNLALIKLWKKSLQTGVIASRNILVYALILILWYKIFASIGYDVILFTYMVIKYQTHCKYLINMTHLNLVQMDWEVINNHNSRLQMFCRTRIVRSSTDNLVIF